MSKSATEKFKEYLRIKTVHPNPEYKKCTEFLLEYAIEIGIPRENCHVLELVPGKDLLILSIPGHDKSLDSLILNSHTDVVPVSEEMWTMPPFGAHSKNGRIYARGSQDMKCVGIWYMEALRVLLKEGAELKRTIHVTFVPDEEIGGKDGMEAFVKSLHFKALNAGFALDEGLANEKDAFKLYYGERSPWWIWITATGNAGHGSKFIEPSATLRLLKVLKHFTDFRDSEQARLETGHNSNGQKLCLGDVTTCNVTVLKAGVQLNVVHEKAEAGVDMRVSPFTDFPTFRKRVESWIASEPGVTAVWTQDFPYSPPTLLTPSNKQWLALQKVALKHAVALDPEIFPAATDSRFLRLAGIPAFGISAIKNTPVLLHDHDEFLEESTLVNGIPFYVDLVKALANI